MFVNSIATSILLYVFACQVQTEILARAAEAASTNSADPRELRCLELCATPAMLQHCFGDEDMDKSYHFCHMIQDSEFNGTVPCLKQCLAGDTDPKSQLLNEKLIRISKNIISCSEDALTFAADDLSVTRSMMGRSAHCERLQSTSQEQNCTAAGCACVALRSAAARHRSAVAVGKGVSPSFIACS